MSNKVWRYIALMFCGILLVSNSLLLDQEPLRVKLSDTLSGITVFLLALLSIYTPRKSVDWILALIGLYLLLAPILLWANTPAAYFNDQFLGVLICTFAILFSPEAVEEGNDGVPPGWTFNPSRYSQRMPIITLAFLAYLFSRYMSFFQLGYLSMIWDPVFGNGTYAVITSNLSKDFPISDAGLGSWVYAVEVLMGIHGSKKRWHTMPWFVTFFAILVIPAGLVSVILIMLQPLVVGSYCFWCLITALCMLFMIVCASDEVVATLLFLRSVRRRGGDVSKVFWHGDKTYETHKEQKLTGNKLLLGISFPWNLIMSALIGLGMMFFQNNRYDSEFFKTLEAVIGALVITFSVISFGEVLRSFRWVNVFLGILFAVLAIYSEGMGIYYHIILGSVLVILAIPKGRIHYSYGEWVKHIH